MKKNVGKADALVRYGIALVAVIVAAILPEFRIPLIVFASVLSLTAYFGLCGLYKVFGINTCPVKQR